MGFWYSSHCQAMLDQVTLHRFTDSKKSLLLVYTNMGINEDPKFRPLPPWVHHDRPSLRSKEAFAHMRSLPKSHELACTLTL